MAITPKKFTPKWIQTVTKPGDYHAGDGLYLQVKKNGPKSWVLRFMLYGRQRKMGLGSVDTVTLAQARDEVRQWRQLLQKKTDPIEARIKQRSEARALAATQITLAEAHDLWLKAQNWEASTAFRELWLWKMYEKLGPHMLSDLADGNLIVEVFTPVCKDFKKSARYALQHLRSIFEWAKDNNRFTGDNPINLAEKPRKSKFLKRLPSLDYEVAHRRPMPWQEVPAFVARLRAQKGGSNYGVDERVLSAEAVELQILTGGRPQQARLAQWDEFDLDNQTWKVPLHTTVAGKRSYRRKRSQKMEIYINRSALALLRSIKKRQESEQGGLRKFVFSHGPVLTSGPDYHPTYAWIRKEKSRFADSEFRYGGKVISLGAMRCFLNDSMGIKNYDLYGFRGSIKQFQVAHGYNELAGEAVLDHQVGDVVRNTYAQGMQPYHPIIELLDHWGRHCDGKTRIRTPQKSGSVIQAQATFRRRR